jgi:signal transduction histidine kinase
VSDDIDAVNRAALGIATERSAERVLERVAEAARRLTGAPYGAVGVPDGHGGFTRFVTAGITEEEAARIGPLPRTHGLLGALLETAEPYRVDDIRRDPRFEGWPAAHPDMGPFLGVPVIGEAGLVGAIYVTRGDGAAPFDGRDLRRLELLAGHAAVAMDNALLWERTRELATAEERDRLALELHDTLTQRLFSLRLTARTAAASDDPAVVGDLLATIGEQAAEALAELRTLILELRPADVETQGLEPALTNHVDLLRRAHGMTIDLDVDLTVRLDSRAERELLRVAQEALANAVRHAAASRIAVRLVSDTAGVRLEVADDGVGFDPQDPRLRATRLGLTSMRHRARSLGGRMRIDSAPGKGTTVALEVPRG